MLHRRILRIKVFKELYSYAIHPKMSLKEASAELERSCEAARDLYLYMLSVIVPLTEEAGRRTEAASKKFVKTEEDLNPNWKFAGNALAPLLSQDADFKKALQRRRLSWEQNDIFLHHLYDSVSRKDYYKAYMADPEISMDQDVKLFTRIFEEEFIDNPELAEILEDMSIYWNDDLAYCLTFCCRSLEMAGKTGRWSMPPLYQSEYGFASKLLQCAFGRFNDYYQMVADAAMKWDKDRLFTTDLVLILLCLAEVENFPDIPVKVSMNEYVEMSKYYGTPKSSSFVNGVIDRLVAKMAEEGRINKKEKQLRIIQN